MALFKKKSGDSINPYIDKKASAGGEFFFGLKRKIKTFAGKHLAMDYTVMLIPHANSKPVNLKMPVGLIIGCVAGVFILLGCTTYFAYQSYDMHRIAAENSGLKKISQSQASQLENLTAMSNDMMEQLSDLYEKDTEFRKNLNMETKLDGKGGVPEPDSDEGSALSSRKMVAGDLSLQKELTALHSKLTEMSAFMQSEEESFEEIEEAVDAKVEEMKCTPTRWPVKGGEVTSKFGVRQNPFGGYSSENHGAIDIACAYGTPIYASGKGVVTEARYYGGYGLTIVISHGYGYTTRYSHCAKIYVEVGDKVKAGEQIGTVGISGRATGPHLDFQMKYNGAVIDPLSVLE